MADEVSQVRVASNVVEFGDARLVDATDFCRDRSSHPPAKAPGAFKHLHLDPIAVELFQLVGTQQPAEATANYADSLCHYCTAVLSRAQRLPAPRLQRTLVGLGLQLSQQGQRLQRGQLVDIQVPQSTDERG